MTKIELKDKIIAIIEDDDGLRFLIQKRLQQAGFTALGFADENELFNQLEKVKGIGLLLLDYKLPNTTASIILDKLHQQQINKPFIIITGHGDEKKAVEMMKLGALDYIVKDEHFFDMLIPVITQAFKQIANKQHSFENLKEEKEQEIYKFINILLQQNNFLNTVFFNGLIRNSNKEMLQNNGEQFIKFFSTFNDDKLQRIHAKKFIDDFISLAKLLFSESKITLVNGLDNDCIIEQRCNILFYALFQIIDYCVLFNDSLRIIFTLRKEAEKNVLQLSVDKSILPVSLLNAFDSLSCYNDKLVNENFCRILLCKLFVIRGLKGNILISQTDNNTVFNIVY